MNESELVKFQFYGMAIWFGLVLPVIVGVVMWGWQRAKRAWLEGGSVSPCALPMMTCDWCGKDFPATAEACLESGVSVEGWDDDGEAWKRGAILDAFTDEQRQRMRAATGLDDGQLEELFRSGAVYGLGAIVCLECQEEALKRDQESE